MEYLLPSAHGRPTRLTGGSRRRATDVMDATRAGRDTVRRGARSSSTRRCGRSGATGPASAWMTSPLRRARARRWSIDTSTIGPASTEPSSRASRVGSWAASQVPSRGDPRAAAPTSSHSSPRRSRRTSRCVESDPDLYRFVVTRPLVDRPLQDDPVGGTVSHVTQMLAGVLETALSAPEHGWVLATALVGSVQAVADDWLASPDRTPRPSSSRC